MASVSDKLWFFQALFWAAWGDDALLDVEQRVLRDLMGNADLEEQSLAIIGGWFDEPPEEPNWDPFANDPDMAEALMRDFALVVLSDKVVNLDEMEQLTVVREAVGMDEPTLHRILRDVEAALATGE